MPDLWDTNSDHVFPTPGEQPDSALSGHDDHSQEVRLRDHRGRLRLPAYILIALVLAVAAIVVLTAVLLPIAPACRRPAHPSGGSKTL
jgi:hypothetical protein